MEKLKISNVLVKNAEIKPIKLKPITVEKVVTKTNKEQTAILKFKEVDQDSLRRVIQF